MKIMKERKKCLSCNALYTDVILVDGSLLLAILQFP